MMLKFALGSNVSFRFLLGDFFFATYALSKELLEDQLETWFSFPRLSFLVFEYYSIVYIRTSKVTLPIS